MLQGKSTAMQPGIPGIPGMSFLIVSSLKVSTTQNHYILTFQNFLPGMSSHTGMSWAPVAQTASAPSAAPLPKLARPARFTGTSKRELLTQQKRPTNIAKET